MAVSDNRIKQGGSEKKTGKKRRGKLIFFIVIFTAVLAMSVSLVLTVTQNLLGGRDALIAFLGSMDPEYVSVQEREAEVRRQEDEIKAREEAVAQREQVLAEKERQLRDQAESRTVSSFEAYFKGLSEERLNQLRQIASIYSNMDAGQAASALAKLGSVQDMAAVLYSMKAEAAALIMDKLDADIATRITESMLE